MPLRNASEGVAVQGLEDMQRVLRKGETGLAPELKKRLREAGERIVVPAARAKAPHGSKYNFGTPLRDTIRSGVIAKGATVYSSSVYGGVQNYGGRVGRHHATVLSRGRVSQYMTTAVRETREPVSEHVEGVLDWLQRELS